MRQQRLRVENKDRIQFQEIGHGFSHMYSGFKDEPNVPRALGLFVYDGDSSTSTSKASRQSAQIDL